ncbi:SusF/SusE family outer membrane protein [Antarcticibacterium flavum]|uniref:SusF/SusE family outer membrane protein n=1 Tax=Antarcticibacterium flavum TaxID=2058175 RepID=A0A5B7X196_9FLAO|nr:MULTISPECIES: SusF/SusE family outer membrane protein [Antarcticibacterium]MCM4161602.1 hypothetical protein [Antarcticibacterium sp. W02-3]QCY69030.1 SusF/SusE family outer membrane protein [Antarcticibacterium flavum]
MKRYLNKLVFLGLALFMFGSCEKDEELTMLQPVHFTAAPVASHNNIVLEQENMDQAVLNISWPEVTYPIQAPVTYNLQFTRPADTVGVNGWANAINAEAGVDVLSKTFMGRDLNELAKDLGLEDDVEGEIAVRVQSYMDRRISSEPLIISVTPFTPEVATGEIYLPGAYQGWDPETAASIPAVENGIYRGYLNLPSQDALDFKITLDRNWTENYGHDGNGNLVFDGPNLSVPEPGFYEITVNFNTMTWTATKTSWGIIGTATEGGWDADTDMVFDSERQVWVYTGELQPGALKFRLNDSWEINYGSRNNEEGIAYLDDPGAHDVTEAGLYEVTFSIDPEDNTRAFYSIEPIVWGIIGDATAGGWDTDTPMTWNSDTGVWEVTADLTPGALKFRRNNDWSLNYGPRNNEDGILYLDDPGAHGIEEAGTYDITLTLNPEDPSTATYTVDRTTN